MKAYLMFGTSGPIVILTSHAFVEQRDLLAKLTAKGLGKFIAFEIPVDAARRHYGSHFDIVMRDLHETDDLRVLDYDGGHIFRLFTFDELGEPIMHEPEPAHA